MKPIISLIVLSQRAIRTLAGVFVLPIFFFTSAASQKLIKGAKGQRDKASLFAFVLSVGTPLIIAGYSFFVGLRKVLNKLSSKRSEVQRSKDLLSFFASIYRCLFVFLPDQLSFMRKTFQPVSFFCQIFLSVITPRVQRYSAFFPEARLALIGCSKLEVFEKTIEVKLGIG